MSNEIIWPSNPFKWERAQDTLEERIENGLFRCDRCQCLKPLPVTWNDGAKVCRRCADVLTPVQAQVSMAEERAANAVVEETVPFAVVGAFSGTHMVTGISPLTLNLTRGGSSGSIAITGVNLDSTDTWSASDSLITVTPTVNSTTSVTLSISASGTTPRGDYNLKFNGDTLIPRSILKVR